MSSLKELIEELKTHDCQLIAVSKTKSNEEILVIYDKGQRAFGENRVQEMIEKQESLPEDIEWHLIGHLQKNKVKYVAPFVKMIQSVDSFKLLKLIDKKAKENERKIEVLLQIKIAEEDTKYGFDFETVYEELVLNQYPNIHFRGVMGMATLTDNVEKVRKEFRTLVTYKNLLDEKYFYDDQSFSEISMGMSGDYKIALEEGSTMVRIGSLIFGEREQV